MTQRRMRLALIGVLALVGCSDVTSTTEGAADLRFILPLPSAQQVVSPMEAPRIVTGPSFSYDPGTMPEELGIDPTIIQVRASTEWIWGTTVHATASMRYFATNGELDLQVQVNSPTGASVTTPKVTEAKYHYIPILPSTTINANTISVVATECGHSAGTFANGLAYHSAPSPAGIL